MPSWLKLVAGWVVAALIALAFAWGAVSQVRNSVIQPTTEIPATVVAAVASSDRVATSTTTIPLIRVEPEPGDPGVGTSTTALSSATSTTQAASSTSTTTTGSGQTTMTTTATIAPSTTTTLQEQTRTSTHTLVGGQVRISYSPGVVSFISAIPQPGFSTELQEDGPEEVRVRFRSESHNSDFRARWEDGELRITANEEAED
jgi:cytoskeletal protein RodZ